MTEQGNGGRDPVDRMALEIQRGNTALLPDLWQAVERFIRYQARKRFDAVGCFGGCEIDDLVQSGYFALLAALDVFNPEKGNFLSILALQLKTAFADAAGIRTSKRDALLYSSSLNSPIDSEDPDGESRQDRLIDPAAGEAFSAVEDRIFEEELHQTITNAVDMLPAAKRDVIKGKYLDGLTSSEIAETRGISKSAVRELERAALRQMRQQARVTGIDRFVEMHTVYYKHFGLEHIQRTGTSGVEELVFDRERLRKLWEDEKKTAYTVLR